jgi:SAM-dependent methyltransferase
VSNFNTYSRYYDLLYKDKNYIAEVDYMNNLLKQYGILDTNELLELGCGSGSHAVHMSRPGLSITGLELSKTMVTEALQKNIKGFQPVVGNITSFQLGMQFDAAVSLFHVISYLTDNNQLLDCFKATNGHLKPGGLFVFDVWYTPAVLTQLPETRIKRLEDDHITVTRLAEPVSNHQANTVEVNYEVWITSKTGGTTEILKEVHPMRHFGIPEIDLLARQTGFKLLHAEEFLTGATPGTSTWGVCFVLSKI